MNTLNNSNENGDFKMKTTEFRGYTLKALEEIGKDISELKEDVKALNSRIEKISNRLVALQTKVAGIGAVAGIVVSLVIHYILV